MAYIVYIDQRPDIWIVLPDEIDKLFEDKLYGEISIKDLEFMVNALDNKSDKAVLRTIIEHLKETGNTAQIY